MLESLFSTYTQIISVELNGGDCFVCMSSKKIYAFDMRTEIWL